MANVRGRFLRTNYRLTGAKADIGQMESVLVQLQTVYAILSDTGDLVTFSTGGYGVPYWMHVRALSLVGGTIIDVMGYSVDQSTSLVYVSLWACPITYTNIGSYTLGSIANTVNVMFEVVALIASR